MKTFLFLLFIGIGSQAHAAIYIELDIEGGGDKLIGTNLGEEINAGGGIKFAVGIENQIGPEEQNSII